MKYAVIMKISKTKSNDFKYNVQEWAAVGGTHAYFGIGKFCRELSDVDNYINKRVSDGVDVEKVEKNFSK